jgi:hypothetical protein
MYKVRAAGVNLLQTLGQPQPIIDKIFLKITQIANTLESCAFL